MTIPALACMWRSSKLLSAAKSSPTTFLVKTRRTKQYSPAPSMAPKPPQNSKGSSKFSKGKKNTGSASSGVKKPGSTAKRPPAKQQKTKPGAHNPVKPKKKTRVYTDKELNLPPLNTITPVGVQKPRGKKKGKIFVDDQESMMTIMAMVNADKEGQIESKMMKARALEEIRDARRKEAEARQERKQEVLEETKKFVKRQRHKKGKESVTLNGKPEIFEDSQPANKSRKMVSFA